MYCHCGMSGSVYCAGANCYARDPDETDDEEAYLEWLEQQAPWVETLYEPLKAEPHED